MADEDLRRLRRDLGRSFSEEQVGLLRTIRSEISSRRWQVMLDIDTAQEDLKAAVAACGEPAVVQVLDRIQRRLSRAHRQLAHIPEDFIPAF